MVIEASKAAHHGDNRRSGRQSGQRFAALAACVVQPGYPVAALNRTTFGDGFDVARVRLL